MTSGTTAKSRSRSSSRNPHILPLFDSGESAGFLYYIMPYVEGETLRDKLNRERQLRVGEAVRIASKIAEALDHAHRHDVIHRDIKPGDARRLGRLVREIPKATD